MTVSVAAVYCVYDDHRWLTASLRSCYPFCSKIFFLMGSRPWSGPEGDDQATFDAIARVPDPEGRIEIIRGEWASETDQRNAGLDLLAERGFDYCLVIDADEVYGRQHLANILAAAERNPEVDVWRVSCVTYWKSHEFRIDPLEPYKPAALVSTRRARFTAHREVAGERQALLEPRVALFHHFSYARSDEEILRKLARFSHASEVAPDWFERVWKGWERDKNMENLNPAYPAAYRRAVPHPFESLPQAVCEELRPRIVETPSDGAFIISLSGSAEQTSAAFDTACGSIPESTVKVTGTPYSFICRPHTTDIKVVFDTFQGLYHLPPAALPPNSLIVDLGSNIGCTMAHFATLLPEATIVGVELDAENAALAKRNTEQFGNRCHVIHAAIWSHDGEVRYEGKEQWGFRISTGGDRAVTAISMRTLFDSLGARKVDYLKIDIEGGEREVFSGDCSWLERVASLKVEIHNMPELFQKLPVLLAQYGFQTAKDTRHWSALCAMKNP